MLRHLRCTLPIQLWYLGRKEVSKEMERLMSKFGVECVDARPIIEKKVHPTNRPVKLGWVLKSVAIARCPFEEVIFIDADNFPVRDPSFLFQAPEYRKTGAVFWPDINVFTHPSMWRIFRVPPRDEPEFESGQIVVDKRINWEAVSLAEKINFRADVFFRLMWGDKDTFRFAWHKLGRNFAMPEFPAQALQAPGMGADMLCQHDFDGNRLFQHRNLYKWKLFGDNPWIPGFFFEYECRSFLKELRSAWNGRCTNGTALPKPVPPSSTRQALCDKVWLIELPGPARDQLLEKKLLSDFARKTPWFEVKFDRNGTVCKGVHGAIGTFWDLESTSGRRPRLRIWGGDGRDGLRIEMEKASGGWQGRCIAGECKVNTRMMTVGDVYPHLRINHDGSFHSRASRDIAHRFRDEVHIGHSGLGIGDHIVAAWACTGLARAGVRVVFHTQHQAWLARIHEPNFIISRQTRAHIDYDLSYDYANELRYGISKAQWYAARLHPLLKPARPLVDRTQKMARVPFERYVLIAPFASRAERQWPEIHWIRLAHMLREAGYEAVAIGARSDAERLERVFNQTQVYWTSDCTPEWVIDALLGSTVYIGVDSGMTHLANLLHVNAVAIHSNLEPEFLWPGGSVRSVSPEARCVFCRGQIDRGWYPSCEQSCSALASVRPETVLDAVRQARK